MSDPIRVLLIEDNLGDADFFRRALVESKVPFVVSHADRLASGLRSLADAMVDVVLLDIDLPDSRERNAVAALRAQAPHVPIVVLTETSDSELAAGFVHEGAQDCLPKSTLDSGSLIRSIRYAIERTARQHAETSLRDSEALYQSLVENLPVSVLRKDLDGRFIFANRAYCEFTERTPEGVLGKTDFDFSPPEVAEKFHADDHLVADTGRQIRVVEVNQTDDRTRWVEVIKTPVCDARGRTVGTQAIFWDVTERQLAVEALKQAKEAAEAASVAKSQFLANMSHEIRTPLNAVLGLTELLLKSELTASQREYLQMVQDSGESLSAVISDILDFSKIEAGKLSLDPAPFDLREQVGDTVKSLALRADEKKLELAVHISPTVPTIVVGDPYRLRQILVNLVGNAIKFTNSGEVVVDVAVESQSEAYAVLHFVVTDTGIGIPEENLSTIFGAFEQVDPSSTRRFGGTGLGLAISHRLVELMGGRIWAQSQIGRGSEFHFTIGFELTSDVPTSRNAELPRRLSGSRVLIVDDHATNRRILEEMFRNWGLQSTSAGGVHEALGRLITGQRNGTAFDLVVTDVHMPEMNGIDFVEALRSEKELTGTAVIMLSSVSVDADLDPARCRELKIGACLTKPAKQSELFDAIVQVLEIQVPEGEPKTLDGAAAPPAVRPLRVLLAEDNWVNRKLGVELLQWWGHTVTVVENGAQAVEAWRTQPFDLIVMDVQMPEMDGLQATQMIRKEEARRGGHVPIMALTAHAMQGDREKCLAAGMDDYVAKPLHIEKVQAAIARVFGTTPGDDDSSIAAADERGQAGAAAASNSMESPTDAEPTSVSAVDWSAALDTVRGNRNLLREIAEAFLVESVGLSSQIRSAIAAGDAAQVRRDAHTLKGSLYLFGNSRAIEGVIRLETSAGNDDLTAAAAAMSQLDAELLQINEALQFAIAQDFRTPAGTG